MSDRADSAPWYAADDLCFECTRCGRCCKGGGRVEVSDAEIARLAAALDLDESAFRESYTCAGRKGRVELAEGRGGRCVLYDGRGSCQVYEDRPSQCRLYPFWPSVFASRENWEDEGRLCEGIGQGRRHSTSEIALLLKSAGPGL
jgi:Fe-S-cluster containining protein